MKPPVIELGRIIKEMGSMLSVGYIQVFLYLVIFDILTGFAKGFTNKMANSTKGLLGIIKHLLVVTLVVTAYPYLTLLQLHGFAIMFVLYFIGSYGISVVENWGRLGLPLPKWVKQYFEKLYRESNDMDISRVPVYQNKEKGDENE